MVRNGFFFLKKVISKCRKYSIVKYEKCYSEKNVRVEVCIKYYGNIIEVMSFVLSVWERKFCKIGGI